MWPMQPYTCWTLNDQFWCSRTFYEDYPGYKDMALRVEKLREDAKDLAEYAYLKTRLIDKETENPEPYEAKPPSERLKKALKRRR